MQVKTRHAQPSMAVNRLSLVLRSEILDALQIDNANREAFCTAVSNLVLYAWRGFKPVEQRAGNLVPPLERIAALAKELCSALSVANENGDVTEADVHAVLSWQLQMRASDTRDVDHVRAYQDDMAKLTSAASDAAAWVRANVKKRQGRPRGVKGHPALGHFIALLAGRVWSAGGTVDVNTRYDTGTLIDLLEVLRPALPRNFMPASEKHPTASYRRILRGSLTDWKSLRSKT